MLSRAHTPDNPDWRILSVQGTTLDKLGKHEEARRYYASALKIVPDEPSVLSNLGLSYMLTGNCRKRRRRCAAPMATAGPMRGCGRTSRLVVGLQGRFAEAESIVKADLPADEAAANVAYLKEMLSRKDNPRAAAKAVAVRRVSRRLDRTTDPFKAGCCGSPVLAEAASSRKPAPHG